MKRLKAKTNREQGLEGSIGLKTVAEFRKMEKCKGACYCWSCKVFFEDTDVVEVRVTKSTAKDAPWPRAYCPLKKGLFKKTCGLGLCFDDMFTMQKEYHVLENL